MLVKDLANLTQLLPNSPIMAHKSFFSLESLFLLRKKNKLGKRFFSISWFCIMNVGKVALDYKIN